jgi:sirohydrochlorin cobaltochelatase
VPLFLGAGGHVKDDLPPLVSAARAAHPGLAITLEDPIGERPEVIVAIADALRR